MDLKKWIDIIELLDSYNIKAIIGVIPDNKDEEINFSYNTDFWEIINSWKVNGHIIALHGLNHLKLTKDSGVIPKNKRSEFSALTLKEQSLKIKKGIDKLALYKIDIDIFIAPFHSFDKNTLKALKTNGINIVYDAISFYPYSEENILFFPQQNNYFIKKKFGIWSICLHPSSMTGDEFLRMENFIINNKNDFKNDFFEIAENYKSNSRTIFDILYYYYYFIRRYLFLVKKRIKNGRG